MKSFITKVCLLAGVLFACVPQLSHAIGLSISSTTAVAGQPIPAFMVRRGESVNYVLTSTGGIFAGLCAGTTVSLEASTNMSNWVAQVTTAVPMPGSIGTGISGTLSPVFQDTFYRWNVLQSSGGAIIVTLSDADDMTGTLVKNNKGNDTLVVYDDSVRIMGASIFADIYTLQASSGGAAIALSSSTQLQWRTNLSTTNYRSYGAPGGGIQIDKSFTLIGSTGAGLADLGTGQGGFTLTATPTISTASAINGDVLFFQGAVSSVTFTSENTLAGTALKLGGTTRALGINDMLGLIYYNGFWREFYFANNFQ